MNENEQSQTAPTENAAPPQPAANGVYVNTHFTLAVVAVCLSCFTGFFAVALALAALILSLRAKDQLQQNHPAEAAQSAYWAAVFGWITVILTLLPVALFLFFGGALLAGLGAAAGMM